MQTVGGWGTDLELAKLLKKDGAQSVEFGRGIAGDVVDLLNGAVVAGREALTVEREVERCGSAAGSETHICGLT